MTNSETRGLTAHEAVLEYCTNWTHFKYIGCWPSLHEVALDATKEMMDKARLAVDREMMAMLRRIGVICGDDNAHYLTPDNYFYRRHYGVGYGRPPVHGQI